MRITFTVAAVIATTFFANTGAILIGTATAEDQLAQADSEQCAQNTPSINIIDNARIMMMPGNIPKGGATATMAQTGAEYTDEYSLTLA